VIDEMYGETTRTVDVKPDEEIEGEAVMEGVEHIGKYVYDMQTAKLEAMRANGGQLPTRKINMRDVAEMIDDEHDDDEDNVVILDGGMDDDDEEEEDTKPDIRNTGRHIEVEATTSVKRE
jgi:intron-binding protein aquarius